MPNLASIDKVLKIEDARARLVGTYATRRQLINVVTDEALLSGRDELLAELERRRAALREASIDTTAAERD
jgi:hypothetical protein